MKYLKPIGWMVLGGLIAAGIFVAAEGVMEYHVRRVQSLEAALAEAKGELKKIKRERLVADRQARTERKARKSAPKDLTAAMTAAFRVENGYLISIENNDGTKDECLIVGDKRLPNGTGTPACWPAKP